MSGERFDYSSERARHENFVGRTGLLVRLDQLLVEDAADRWVVITGGPGMGKSALLAAWLALRVAAGAVVLHHFIRRGLYDWDDPAKLVGSLVAQIEDGFPELREPEADERMGVVAPERMRRWRRARIGFLARAAVAAAAAAMARARFDDQSTPGATVSHKASRHPFARPVRRGDAPARRGARATGWRSRAAPRASGARGSVGGVVRRPRRVAASTRSVNTPRSLALSRLTHSGSSLDHGDGRGRSTRRATVELWSVSPPRRAAPARGGRLHFAAGQIDALEGWAGSIAP
jgi:hypothetical protein